MASSGGFDVGIFVETPPLLFDCPLCHRVLRRPHLTTCGRNVCESCLDDNRSPCPLCNGAVCGGANDGPSAVLNRHVWNEISQLQVHCSCEPAGCDWVGSVEQFVDKHEKGCGYVEVACGYGCGLKVPRRQSDDHLQVCERYPVSCPRECGAAFERRLCKAHLSRDCPLQEIACLFKEDGCTIKMKRSLLKGHLDAEVCTHIGLVAKSSSEARKKWCKERDALIAEQEAKLKAREEEIAALSKTLRGLEDKAQSLQKLVATTEKEIRNLQQEQTRSSTVSQQEILARDAEVKMMKDGIFYLQKQTQVKCLGPPLPQYAQHFSRPFPPTTEIFIPPLELTIDNFTQRKNDDECWYSPPFYSHHGGYKLCLEVYPNGLDVGRARFVSIYVTLMKGEYDDGLKWPFSGCLCVTVLCQNRGNANVAREITFRGTKRCHL